MLIEYNNSDVTYTNVLNGESYELIERIDCHYTGFSSDKVYIGTVQKTTAGTFIAICYYGRRGASLTSNVLREYKTFHEATVRADKQMKEKRKKGYNLIDHWRKGGTGELRPEVVKFLQQSFPVGSRIQSPSGNEGEIFGYSQSGIGVSVDGQDIDVPWEKVGAFKVVR